MDEDKQDETEDHGDDAGTRPHQIPSHGDGYLGDLDAGYADAHHTQVGQRVGQESERFDGSHDKTTSPAELLKDSESDDEASNAHERGDGTLFVPEKLTQQDIADRVGASREMVARILKDLTIGEYIRFEGRHIVINTRLPAKY